MRLCRSFGPARSLKSKRPTIWICCSPCCRSACEPRSWPVPSRISSRSCSISGDRLKRAFRMRRERSAPARSRVTRSRRPSPGSGRFTSDNRAGIEGTLHRIAALRNRRGEVIGLTCRVGRAVTGIIEIVRDVFAEGRERAPARPPRRRQNDAPPRGGARPRRRPRQAGRRRRHLERDRRRRRRAASGHRQGPPAAGAEPRAAARGDDRGRREPHAARSSWSTRSARIRKRSRLAPSPSAACSSSPRRTAPRSRIFWLTRRSPTSSVASSPSRSATRKPAAVGRRRPCSSGAPHRRSTC